MAEHHAAEGKHLGQIAQTQLVAQAPEHHERDDVGGVWGPVQLCARALVELLAAGVAAEAPVTLGGAFGPLRKCLRPAPDTLHARPRGLALYRRQSTVPRPLARALTEPRRCLAHVIDLGGEPVLPPTAARRVAAGEYTRNA
jgi:hypothetical protein